ncbi:MAG TPA: methyltransferase, partial [Thermoanaerobaculia bacterium]|nr:methyltransferase [Thermoanaerobaculia bacterium]
MTPRVDLGSFRDRSSRVFYVDGGVYRALDGPALAAWRQLAQTAFFGALLAEGKVVASEEVPLPSGVPANDGAGWAGALRHQAVPFVSYPYEWPFGMLREAARLQLELQRRALEAGYTLKDASAYNVQWRGGAPLFIDVPSFVPRQPGEPWVGYLQFCQLFLYPLLLTARRGIDFHPFLRSQLDGIAPQQCDRLLGWRHRLSRGVLVDVWLQARLQAATAGTAGEASLRRELRRERLPREVVSRNVRRLEKVVERLAWEPGSSTWSEYADTCSYSDRDAETKRRFVAQALGSRAWRLAWDLGCNTGEYARLASEHAEYTVALDGDHLAIERLYRRLAAAGDRRILPLVYDLMNPSPGLGWRGVERRTLLARGRPDLVLALALLHHLAFTGNVPLPELVDWLASFGGHVVVELVTKDDPMARHLLRNKDDQYGDYTVEGFDRLVAERFEVVA